MIKVNKHTCPEILKHGKTPHSNGEDETRQAILFYNNVANHTLTFKRKGKGGKYTKESYIIYSDPTVKKELKTSFKGKCAYCESKILVVSRGDIEHFRPKGAYHNKNGQVLNTPGYYWLASEWENLLLACTLCNQSTTHEFTSGTKKKIIEVVKGKQNQFPISGKNTRLNHTHGNIYFNNKPVYLKAFKKEEQKRLLLKPCTDEVEEYFAYSDEGLILPKLGLTYFKCRRAVTSIDVYALQRLPLVQAREKKIIEIKAQINRVEKSIKRLNDYKGKSDKKKKSLDDELNDEMKILMIFKDPDQEYSGLARYIIDKYFDDANFV